ncbi:hypothetical protein GQ37_015905 [Janthinobacterium sp. BJB1]|uniref:hypothetical protein n=1 Tax=Janthinobacterium sp. GW458P TaxID=1981504 RepID=UPI000A32AB90|nr:hypothetical protein [Janthinobacterium sp. GW458P]MBE3027109.1 hypothetical protein [Janthinobacterium sp. GW458P]PJC97468.1 hypothetical protein GQ37_015905 [Janthinobacterium sp. BJB1]
MKNVLTFLVLGAALSACGGGSGGGAPETPATPPVVVTPPVTPADSVTLASEAVAKEAGLNVIAGAGADESVYDVAADIGDTWRITFDRVKKTYAIRVLSTQFGLSDRSGTFSATTAGNLTTYTATDFSVTVDARTRLLSGNIKLGNMASTVSGTGYTVGDVARLAGSYIFLGAMRNASNGADRFNPKGSFRIAADGAARLCNGGVFDAQGVCSAVPGLPPPEGADLTLVKDAKNGLLVARQGGQDFGIVHVHAGDRGLALFIDRYSRNQENVLRVGTIVAAKQQKIGTEINGSYACAEQGGTTGKIDIAGNVATITNNASGKVHGENVSLNKLGTGSQAVEFDGVAVFKDPADALADYAMFMPVSSSMAVQFSTDRSFLTSCLKK